MLESNLEKLQQWISDNKDRRASINIDTDILSGQWEVVLNSTDEDYVVETSDDLDKAIATALERAWLNNGKLF